MTRTETEELRHYLTQMAYGLVVEHTDGTYDPEKSAKLQAWLRHLANLNDEALGRALS